MPGSEGKLPTGNGTGGGKSPTPPGGGAGGDVNVTGEGLGVPGGGVKDGPEGAVGTPPGAIAPVGGKRFSGGITIGTGMPGCVGAPVGSGRADSGTFPGSDPGVDGAPPWNLLPLAVEKLGAVAVPPAGSGPEGAGFGLPAASARGAPGTLVSERSLRGLLWHPDRATLASKSSPQAA